MLDNGYKYSDNYYIEKELSKLNMKIEYYKNSTYSSSYKKLKNKFTSKKIKKICKYPLGNDYKIIKDILKKNIDALIFVKSYNCSLEISKIKIKNFESTIFLGELSLDGKINRVNGVLPICIEALELGIKRVVLPKENAIEASIIKGLEIIPVEDLLDAIEYITGNLEIPSYVSKENINLRPTQNYEFDFSDVKGQENAKRAVEIAATGSHNCLLCRCARFGKKPIIRKNSYNFTRFNI